MCKNSNFVIPAVLLAVTPLAMMARPASAQTFTINFENATVPNHTGPNLLDCSNTFAEAYPSDTVQGVTFSDAFSVYRNTYTNGVGGNALYGTTLGSLALTNTAGVGGADTGPADAGLDGLTFTTNAVLQSAFFAANDYGNDSFGTDQVTVNALHGTTILSSVSLALADGSGNPIRTLTQMSTSAAFTPYAGQITGYSINRSISPLYKSFGSGGGNYDADNFSFAAPAPEPGAPLGLALGVMTLTGWVVVGRRSAQNTGRSTRKENRDASTPRRARDADGVHTGSERLDRLG